jgi:uncharacterized protein (DUF983 family)
MPEKSSLTALLEGKCPRCRAGDMFAYPASNLRRFNVMNDVCPQCGLRLEPEPGFYQGAMYVSYGFTIAFMVVIGLLLYFFAGDPSEWVYIGVVVAVMFLLVPLNYRYSRIVFLYLFGGVKYDPHLSK